MSLGADSENWRAISEYPNYQVSDLGRVRNTTTWKILKPPVGNHGYHVVVLYNETGKKMHLVHRLVASEFLDNPDGRKVIDHIDRCKTNNFAINLRYCNQSENGGNTAKRRGATTSSYKGVWYCKTSTKF